MNVRWGSYNNFEGPYVLGVKRYELPSVVTEDHILLDVITQTEGGTADAVNMYDKCMVSLGFIQLCESPWGLSSALLGSIATANPSLLNPLNEVMRLTRSEFKKDFRGKWAFVHKGSPAVTRVAQEDLFLGGASGQKGSWTDDRKSLARLWCESFSNVLAQPEAIEIQVKHVAPMLKRFATKEGRDTLFRQGMFLGKGYEGAVQAAFLSFAANNPTLAGRMVAESAKKTTSGYGTRGWALTTLKDLTFGPNIAIYPDRYSKIRPKLEKHFGVDLPDFAAELQKWESTLGPEASQPLQGEPKFLTTFEIQTFLLKLGYDLGPKGADGTSGQKTQNAIKAFQTSKGVKVTGYVDADTRAKMVYTYRQG